MLKKRIERLATAAGGDGQWEFPDLTLPEEMKQFSITRDGNELGGEALFLKIASLLGGMDLSATILAFLGWVAIDPRGPGTVGDPSSPPTMTLGCPLCLSVMDVTLRKNGDGKGGEDGEPPEKRRKSHNSNPLGSHRYYCPYVCGFPATVSAKEIPLWHLLVQRSERELEVPEGAGQGDPRDDASSKLERIQKILRMAVAPKRIDLDEVLE